MLPRKLLENSRTVMAILVHLNSCRANLLSGKQLSGFDISSLYKMPKWRTFGPIPVPIPIKFQIHSCEVLL